MHLIALKVLCSTTTTSHLLQGTSAGGDGSSQHAMICGPRAWGVLCGPCWMPSLSLKLGVCRTAHAPAHCLQTPAPSVAPREDLSWGQPPLGPGLAGLCNHEQQKSPHPVLWSLFQNGSQATAIQVHFFTAEVSTGLRRRAGRRDCLKNHVSRDWPPLMRSLERLFHSRPGLARGSKGRVTASLSLTPAHPVSLGLACRRSEHIPLAEGPGPPSLPDRRPLVACPAATYWLHRDQHDTDPSQPPRVHSAEYGSVLMSP